MARLSSRPALLAFAAIALCSSAYPQTPSLPVFSQTPKVRAITAFVHLERDTYQAQTRDTVEKLRAAQSSFEKAGYQVQTLRIATQPFPAYIRGLSRQEALAFFRAYDGWLRAQGYFNNHVPVLVNIGPAMLSDTDDLAPAELLADVLPTMFYSSLVVADKDGVHWRSVKAAARVIKTLAENSSNSEANFAFAASALVPPGTPFYPGGYYLGPGQEFAVALESANVVAEALASAPRDPARARQALEESLGAHARRIEAIADQLERQIGWRYLGMDLSPAPNRAVSIGAAVESFTGTRFGSSGTMTAAALITEALRRIPVKRIGYNGLMVPVLEDDVLAQRWGEGGYNLDSLLAYSAVCGTGIDAVPLPGDVSVEQLERMVGDMATLAVKLGKPLSARLMPVNGKRKGDRTSFQDPSIVNTTLQPLP